MTERRTVRRVEPVAPLFREPLPTDPCKRCSHPRSEHYAETEKWHTHYKHGQRVPTTNHDPYCHAPICNCIAGFVEPDAIEIPVNWPRWYMLKLEEEKAMHLGEKAHAATTAPQPNGRRTVRAVVDRHLGNYQDVGDQQR